MKIYITRHSETYWNSKGKIQTDSDNTENELTELGKKQSFLKGQKLKDQDIKYIFHSGMKRTYQTAWYINLSLNANLISEPTIKDGSLALFEGKTPDECKQDPHTKWYYIRRENDKWHYKAPFCQSMEELADQTKPFCDQIKKLGCNILIISHKSAMKTIIYNLTGWSIKKILQLEMNNDLIYCIDSDKKTITIF